MWPMVPSSSRQWKHLFAKDHLLLFKQSKVNTFTQEASQAKKLTLEGTHEFQITLAGKGTELSVSKVKYKPLAENFPYFNLDQITLSS